MSNPEDKKAQLVSLLGESRQPARPRTRKAPAALAAGGNVIQINGNGLSAQQIVAGDVHHYAVARPPRPRVVVTPGDGVVTDDQKVAINTLRVEWIGLHNSIKRSPLTDAAAWSRINGAAGVTSYHLIPLERFDIVVGFIKTEMAKLRNMASAPAKGTAWRAKRIGAIKARCKNQLGDAEAYKPYIRKAFGAESLTALSTDELQRTYTYIMAKKPGGL
jgi:hypothetical protein